MVVIRGGAVDRRRQRAQRRRRAHLDADFRSPVWLPNGLRNAALTVLPCLHSYEMIRAGLFGDQVQTFYDIGCATACLAVLILIGLWLVRGVRRNLELEW
jgi:hypothetical protein